MYYQFRHIRPSVSRRKAHGCENKVSDEKHVLCMRVHFYTILYLDLRWRLTSISLPNIYLVVVEDKARIPIYKVTFNFAFLILIKLIFYLRLKPKQILTEKKKYY